MHLIDQLLGAGGTADQPARTLDLGDHGRALLIHFGQGKPQACQTGNILDARVGKIAAADLPRTFQQMPHQSPAPQTQPVVLGPAELEDLWRQEQ